jgi:hypothetical protein
MSAMSTDTYETNSVLLRTLEDSAIARNDSDAAGEGVVPAPPVAPARIVTTTPPIAIFRSTSIEEARSVFEVEVIHVDYAAIFHNDEFSIGDDEE